MKRFLKRSIALSTVVLLLLSGLIPVRGEQAHSPFSKAEAATTATIIFYSNGGTAVDPVTTTTNTYFSSFPTVTKEGYMFDGWYVDEALTVKAYSPYYLYKEVTVFYAKWIKVSVVSLTATYETTTAYFGKLLDKSKITVVATYSNNAKGTVTDFTVEDLKVHKMGLNTFKVTYEGVSTTFTVMGIEAVYYTVTFNSNGGSTVTPVSGIEKGATISLPAEPVRDYYKFKGWYIDTAFTVEFTAETKITSNLTVYAKWEEIPDPPEEKTVYKLNKKNIFLKPGAQDSIFIPSYDPDLISELDYESTRPNVVSVVNEGKNKGVITGKKAGTAYIMVTIPEGDVLRCKVVVGRRVTAIRPAVSRVALKAKKTYTLKVRVTPSNATNKKLSYSSSNKKVATVSSKGKITAKKKGTCYITIKATDGSGLKRKVKVVVK